MILHKPEIIHQRDRSILWARMEMDRPRENLPDYLWYRIPAEYGDYFTLQSDSFIPPALIAGMHYGEDIEVRGAISPSLAYHLDEYKYLLSIRFPEIYRNINIQFAQIEAQDIKAEAVGTLFSGGVDSLFTLWQHMPQNQSIPNYQITHGLFIKGFNILHGEEDYYSILYDEFAKEFKTHGVDLIQIETNLFGILNTRLPLTYRFGPINLGVGLALAGLFRIFYIPSSYDHHKIMKKAYTSDPMLDSLLSTNSLRIIHHGSTHLRVEKVEEIANWDLSQKLLYVCENVNFSEDKWNCSRCEKCFRTMIPLYAMGELDKYKSFKRPIRKNQDSLWWIRKFSLRHNYVSQLFPFVKSYKPDIVPWLKFAALIGIIRYLVVEYMPTPLKNWLKRYGYYVNRIEAPNAYEFQEVKNTIQESIDHATT